MNGEGIALVGPNLRFSGDAIISGKITCGDIAFNREFYTIKNAPSGFKLYQLFGLSKPQAGLFPCSL
jgi:hypothetical protein